MSEDRGGLKRIISIPSVYNLVQLVAGARLYRARMVRDYIKPPEGCRILDIGCGTGEYVEFLDNYCSKYEYFGFDAEARYVAYGERMFSDRSDIHFYHRVLDENALQEFNNFDIVLAIGVMHHLDDRIVLSLLRLAKKALRPAGRLVTYDPGRFPDMNRIETFFVNHDRGRNIRFPEEYDRLISHVFPTRKMYLPYLTYYPSRNVVFDCFKD
jgi:SAM-dependent methyltransferase